MLNLVTGLLMGTFVRSYSLIYITSCVSTEEERGSFSSLYLERLRVFDSSKLHMNQ